MRRALTIWLPLFALYAATLGIDAAPGERLAPDEARFLAAAEQLAGGGGLDRGPQGIGFPLLLAPVQALGGATLCAVVLAAVAALAFTLGAALARRVVPDPWPTWAALATGAAPVALGHATVLVPALLAGALLAGACLCALRMRERPLMRDAFGGAAMLALLPWLDPWLLVPALPVAVLLARWTARRGRTMVALGTAEIQLASLVFYVSLNERLYGGLSPLTALDGPVTGASGAAEYAERIPRLVALFADPGDGLLRWAPVVGARLRRGLAAVALAARAARPGRRRPARRGARRVPRARRLRRAGARRRLHGAVAGGRLVPRAPARARAALRGRADRLGLAAPAAGGRRAGGRDGRRERVGAARRGRLDRAARRRLTRSSRRRLS